MSGTLVLTTSFPRFVGDAAGHFVRAEVLAACRAGEPVRVLSGGRGEPADDAPYRLEWLGGSDVFQSPGAWPRLRERPLRALSLLGALARAHWRLTRATERQLVVHWLLPFGLMVLCTDHAARARVTLVAHGTDVRLLRRLPSRVLGALLEAWARRGVALRLVSRELLDELRATPRLSPTARRWLDEARIEPAAIEIGPRRPRSQMRARLGLPPESPLVLVLGRLIASKRVDVALAAASLLPGAVVVVVGEGPERARLQAAHPDALFLGELPRPEALDWLAASDVLLSASDSEGAPTSVREARALGVPVVCRRVGDLGLWAQDDPGLWLVDATPAETERQP